MIPRGKPLDYGLVCPDKFISTFFLSRKINSDDSCPHIAILVIMTDKRFIRNIRSLLTAAPVALALLSCATGTDTGRASAGAFAEGNPIAEGRPAWVDDGVYPFPSRFYDWEGIRMHYIDERPEGVPRGTVVAIHGNGTWSIIYRKMIIRLREEGFRVIAMDHFGFGLSDFPHPRDFDYRPHSQAEVVEDLITALDLEDIYMVLQDWGGPIGLAVAERHPQRMSGFLLMNTWAWALPDYPEDEFNPYHVVHDRGMDAAMNPSFYLNGDLVRGGARGLARRNAEKGSELYNALETMQMAPYIKLEKRDELLYQGVTLPVWISARSTVEDHDFLDSVEKNISAINSLPVYFMFGDDTAFGPLKVDRGVYEKRIPCPEGYRPDSEEIGWKTNCVDVEGELVWPYLDRFLSLWNGDAVAGIWQDPSHGHWLQDEVPGVCSQAVISLSNLSGEN